VTVRLCGPDPPAAPITTEHNGGVTLAPAERRLLARMPLHVITSVHGEAGLRERLAMELAARPADGRARVAGALALASRLHARDRRQHEPYVNHLSVTWNPAVMPSFATSPGCHPGAGCSPQ
jgi:hypothetical protein